MHLYVCTSPCIAEVLLRLAFRGRLLRYTMCTILNSCPHICSPPCLFTGVPDYVIRMRSMNLLLRVAAWVSAANDPQVWADFQKCSSSSAAPARAQVLQQTLTLAFGDLKRVCHFGASLTMMDGTRCVVSPRVVLYVSDQPDERDMCVRRRGTERPSAVQLVRLLSAAVVAGRVCHTSCSTC